jgi:iron complex outermembrane receptor protein
MTDIRSTDSAPALHRPPLARAAILVLWLAIAVCPAVAGADEPSHTIEGTVTDRIGDPVDGAVVVVDGTTVAVTDSSGRFSFDLAPGPQVILVTHPAFRSHRHELTVDGNITGVQFALSPPMSVSDSITVTAIRAGEEVPVTKRNLDREEIEELGYGQDVPTLLQYTPSMTWYSDSGVGSNYSYFSLRGIQQTRINMTFDGAPLNDPAEHALYFNNFHDFTSAVDSIQIQRGVGTSSVGAPSYGGSVSFASVPHSQSGQGEARLAFGSYDTQRASVAYQTGFYESGLAFSGRVSYASTDGYRENSGTEHHTFFLNAEWRGERSTLKFVSFSGDEKTQLSFLAVDPDTLSQNPRFNPLAEEERDHFGQDFAQLQYTRAIGDDTVLAASLYYNGADGFFLLWDDPAARNDLLEFGIDQYFIGSMVSLSRETDRLSTTIGAHYNDFQGDHTLDIDETRIYGNTGFKQTANAFIKAEYRLGSWLLFGDAQLRWADFSYRGDLDLGSVDWTFFDPKIGFRRFVSPRLSVYASIGKAEREPTRMDLLLGEDNASIEHDLEAVKPEQVIDVEAGLNLNTPTVALQANLYSMEFSNEIALTGELSEIGLPLRRNVDDSYRRGLEIDLRWLLGRHWAITHSSNLSRNRISEWTQYYDVFDAEGSWIGSESLVHRDVPPLLTPEVVINQGVEWARQDVDLALVGRYVDHSHLDNTGNDDLRAPSYFNLDLRGSLTLSRWRSAGRPKITLYVNNLLGDDDQYPSGYSWLFINRDAGGNDSIDGIPFYYPLATRNFVVTLDFKL